MKRQIENDKEREKRTCLLIGDAVNLFIIAREKHGEPFSCDLASAMTTYLRDREHGFTVADIRSAWKNPSRDKNAAEHFFSSIVFPRLYACGMVDEEADALVASFLKNVVQKIEEHFSKNLENKIGTC